MASKMEIYRNLPSEQISIYIHQRDQNLIFGQRNFRVKYMQSG